MFCGISVHRVRTYAVTDVAKGKPEKRDILWEILKGNLQTAKKPFRPEFFFFIFSFTDPPILIFGKSEKKVMSNLLRNFVFKIAVYFILTDFQQ